MVKFTRHKLASVYQKDQHTLAVHGVLEDDIYGFEVDLDIHLPELEILSVQGRWNRMENSQCPRAIPFLQEAVGMVINEEFARQVQKVVGRKACRHFADLILECCTAARDAAALLADRHGDHEQSVAIEGLFGSPARPVKPGPAVTVRESAPPSGTKSSPGMVIDLHVHTLPASPCSTIAVEQLIEEAMAIGLDGICLTDHNHLWELEKVEALRQRYGFPILRGNEITTEQGDILVFGLEEHIKGVIKLEQLRHKVLQAGGFMIAAHPFRGFLTFGVGYLGLTREKAMARPVFNLVDAVDVLNSKVSRQENSFAAQVAEGLGLPMTGGSDAHGPGEVGIYATRFPCRIQTERELIDALKQGGYAPVVFRSGKNAAE